MTVYVLRWKPGVFRRDVHVFADRDDAKREPAYSEPWMREHVEHGGLTEDLYSDWIPATAEWSDAADRLLGGGK